MLKIVLLAALAVLSFVGPANATTYVVTLNPSALANSQVVASNTAKLTGNIDLASAQKSGAGAGQYTGSSPGNYLSPGGWSGAYLYVRGSLSSYTFSLASHVTGFGLKWGTVDSYNTLTLKSGGSEYRITGTILASILSKVIAGINVNATNINLDGVDVIFKLASGTISSVVMTSSLPAFEAANFSSVVPLPPAAWLFLSALFVVTAVAARKKALGRI